MATVRAYVGLGANLGDAEATLTAAVRALGASPGIRMAGVSSHYVTRPVGPPGQPEYRNAVVALDVRTPRGPRSRRGPSEAAITLLRLLKAMERVFGRRPRRRWAPRELDLDLLVFGRHVITVAEPSLRVPHPLARERLFVLAPLRDLAPGLRPPGWGETVERAYRRRLDAEGPEAVRAVARWDDRRGRWKRGRPRDRSRGRPTA